MKPKIPRIELTRKAESIKSLVDDIINERIDLPDKALVVDFDATLNIFTKKRMELLELINSSTPTSVQELANLSKRAKQAVDRDLKMLERFDVIALEKRGKFTVPIVKREMIVLNLKKPQEVTDVYLNNNNPINKIVHIAT